MTDEEEVFYPEPETYDPPVAALLTIGDARESFKWPDYPKRYGLTLKDAPELLRMVKDEGLNWAESDTLEVWAPIHAWRALGQLRAVETIPGLLNVLAMVDEDAGDWQCDEFPQVMGLMGAAAIPHLQTFLADADHALYARVAAASGLAHISRRHPSTRAQCVHIIEEQLSHYRKQDPELNGYLVLDLEDLEATEAAATIEAAFAAHRVDVSIAGDWDDLQVVLGLQPPTMPKVASLPSQSRPQTIQKVGRNDPCPCGSGLKYKKCHGKSGGNN